jgi:hypothetical protein
LFPLTTIRTDPPAVSKVREYDVEGAVVVEVVVAGAVDVVEVEVAPFGGRVEDVVVVAGPTVVEVMAPEGFARVVVGTSVEEGIVVSEAAVTSTESAATSGDPSGSASSVTCERTDPTAADAITTAMRVAPIQAAAILSPRFIQGFSRILVLLP